MTMESSGAGYLQVKMAGMPVGSRIPVAGERCPRRRHDYVTEEYPGLTHMRRDRVCTKCSERKMLDPRPFREGEKPDYAAAIRIHTSNKPMYMYSDRGMLSSM